MQAWSSLKVEGITMSAEPMAADTGDHFDHSIWFPLCWGLFAFYLVTMIAVAISFFCIRRGGESQPLRGPQPTR